MHKLKIFHVEDYQIMRDGVKALLEQDPGLIVVGSSANGDHLIENLSATPVDILILDIYLDAMEDLTVANGFEICALVKETWPDLAIVIHTAYDDSDSIARVMKAGVNGFVSKKSGVEELVKAVKKVAAGGKYICRHTTSQLKNLNGFLTGLEILKSKNEVFSRRERQVLNYLAEGKSSREIAELLFLGERTIESHRKNMVEKCNLKNTAELIAYASSLGIIKKYNERN